jgi:ParB/RepB/Spo0J family partition protein
VDVAKKIAETLNWKLAQVQDVFEISEDKVGFFVLKLKPKKFLDTADFRTVCALTRDLGGDDGYVKFSKSWKVPSAFVKKTETKKEPPVAPKSEPTSPYALLPVDALLTMPFIRRKDVEGSDFEDLIESVKAVGVLEPIIVRPKPNGLFEVVVGDRRHAAAKKAELPEIPAIVKPLSDEEAYGIRIVENVQRKDLSDMEKADWLSFMIKTFGYTQRALAEKLGKSESWVSQHLSMLKLHPGEVQSGDITERQARGILSASPEKREEILDQINETGKVPSSREIEKQVKSVPCAHCGEPVSEPVHLDGKFYHEDCAEQVQAEKTPGLIPESSTGPFEKEEAEDSQYQEGSKSEAKPEKIDTGFQWECPECKRKLQLIHVKLPNGKIVHEFEGDN